MFRYVRDDATLELQSKYFRYLEARRILTHASRKQASPRPLARGLVRLHHFFITSISMSGCRKTSPSDAAASTNPQACHSILSHCRLPSALSWSVSSRPTYDSFGALQKATKVL